MSLNAASRVEARLLDHVSSDNPIYAAIADDAERFDTVLRYSSDPAFRAEMDAEQALERARANAAIDAGIAKYRATIAKGEGR